jgi:3-oxoacyl-[acyl-carrier protein] reductase
MDVTNRDQVQSVFKQIKDDFGRIDILVNNAGTLDHVARIDSQNPDLWERDLRVNLTGSFNCAQAAWPHMVEGGFGRIINMASVAGTLGGFGQASYSTTKAGLIGLTKTLARELAPHVRCNAIAPGPVATEMWFSVREDVQRQVVDREIPLKRIAQPEDIARAGLDISSWPDATGIVVVLDGGRIL